MQKSSAGFSLIEVTMALAIMAFALVILLALLPMGLETTRSSAQLAMSSNLLSALISDVKSIPADKTSSAFYEIPVWDESAQTGQIFLDEQGNRTTSGNFNYVVRWRIQRPPTNSHDPLLIHLRIDPSKVADPPNVSAANGSVETLVALIPRS